MCGAFSCPKEGIFMGRNVSIAVSMKDNFSQVINTMRNAGIHFNKKLEEMQFQLNSLNKTRAALRCAGDKNRDDRTLRLRYNRCDEGGRQDGAALE